MISYRLKQDIVADTVREWIMEGKYRPGDQLPTDSDLSEMFQMNRRTIGIGLNQLVFENILERAPRRGTVVKKSLERPLSNAVALVAVSEGDVYSEMARLLNLRLQEHGLYPVLLNNELVGNTVEITSFLNCMTDRSRPYGILAVGDMKFPYGLLCDNPSRYPNTVFMIRYHHPEELPNARYVLTDYEACGRLAVEYFASHGARRILFPALAERDYAGPWSSMQVQIMQSIAKYAAACGILFDEPLFWRMLGGAPFAETFGLALVSSDVPTGIFAWSDAVMVQKVFPVLRDMGKDPVSDFTILGNFNTPLAASHHFASFNIRTDEIAELSVGMLTNQNEERKILIAPGLAEHGK